MSPWPANSGAASPTGIEPPPHREFRPGTGEAVTKMRASVPVKKLVASHARQSGKELERLFTLSLDLLCIAGFDGHFKRLNPAWDRTLGFTLEELLAKPYLDFVHEDDRAATITEARRLATGDDTVSFENRYRCKDGSYKW